MVGLAERTVSPSSSSTSRSTPCVLGCSGPMLTVITSVLMSGISRPFAYDDNCSTTEDTDAERKARTQRCTKPGPLFAWFTSVTSVVAPLSSKERPLHQITDHM